MELRKHPVKIRLIYLFIYLSLRYLSAVDTIHLKSSLLQKAISSNHFPNKKHPLCNSTTCKNFLIVPRFTVVCPIVITWIMWVPILALIMLHTNFMSTDSSHRCCKKLHSECGRCTCSVDIQQLSKCCLPRIPFLAQKLFAYLDIQHPRHFN